MRTRFLAIPFGLALCGALHAAELFVSPTGRDDNPGTKARPLASLEAARDRLRALAPAPRVLVLRAGTYARGATLELDARDSGLTVRGEPGVRLIGGEVVSGWAPCTDPRLPAAARGQAREIPLSGDRGALTRRGFGISAPPPAPELFVDGVAQTLARWPNAGEWSVMRSGGTNRFGVSVEPERLRRWAAAEELWVHGYWTYDWADTYERVASVDVAAATLATVPPHGAYGYKEGKRFYALNLIEELDAPGEYWIDRVGGRLVAWLPDKGETVVSRLTTPLVTVTGATNVAIERLTLACSRGEGIRVAGGANVRIAGCTVRGLGTSGISVEGGRNHRVLSCDLYDLGESGVSVSGGDRRTLEPAGHVVENCDIHHISRLCRTYRPAVGLQGVGNVARRNHLHDGPHNAILMGGNDHLVEGNEIDRVCTQTGDAGAVYMGRNLTMRGTVIRGNHFHDIGPTITAKDGFVDVMAVYLDDCFCGTTIVSNVFERAGRAMMIGGGRDNVVANNLFLDCNPAMHVDARGIGWASFWFDGRDPFLMDGLKEVPYDRPPYATRYPHLAGILQDEPARAKYNRLLNNVVIGKGKPIDWLDGLSEAAVETSGNTFVKTPAEVRFDPVHRRVQAAGFQPLAFDRIGLYRDAYRRRLADSR